MRKLVAWSLIVAGISGCTMATSGGYSTGGYSYGGYSGVTIRTGEAETYTVNGYRRFMLPTKSGHAYMVIVFSKGVADVSSGSEHVFSLGSLPFELENFSGYANILVIVGDGSRIPIDVRYNGDVLVLVGEDSSPWVGHVRGKKVLSERLAGGKLVLVMALGVSSVEVVDPYGYVIASGKDFVSFSTTTSGKYKYVLTGSGDEKTLLISFKFDF